jgi:hypothetical protein
MGEGKAMTWNKFAEKEPECDRWIWVLEGIYIFPVYSWKGISVDREDRLEGTRWTYAFMPDMPKEEIKTEWHRGIDKCLDGIRSYWFYTKNTHTFRFCRSDCFHMFDVNDWNNGYWTYGTEDKKPEPPVIEKIMPDMPKEEIETEWHEFCNTLPTPKNLWAYHPSEKAMIFFPWGLGIECIATNGYYWTYGTKDKRPEPPVIESVWIEYAKERPPFDGWYYVSNRVNIRMMEKDKYLDNYVGVLWGNCQYEPWTYWRHIPESDKKYGKI